MALSRGMTALRAALGAVGGGLEGYAQMQELERKRQQEAALLERQRRQDERQAMLDEATMRGEERAAAAAGMIPATQYTGLSPFDMPGATPRQPLLRQTIGGRELVLPEAPKMAEHRAGAAKAIGERKEKAQKSEALRSALANVEIGGKKVGDEQAAALEQLSPNERTIILGAMRDAAARSQRQTTATAARGTSSVRQPSATDLTKETEGLSFLQEYASDQDVINRVGAAIADNPALAERPGLIGYGILQDYKKRGMYTKGGAERATPTSGRPAGRAPTAPPPIPGAATMPAMPNQPPAVDPLRKFYDRGQR